MIIKNVYLIYLLYFLILVIISTFLIVLKNKKKEKKINIHDRDVILVNMENTIGTWFNKYKKTNLKYL